MVDKMDRNGLFLMTMVCFSATANSATQGYDGSMMVNSQTRPTSILTFSEWPPNTSRIRHVLPPLSSTALSKCCHRRSRLRGSNAVCSRYLRQVWPQVGDCFHGVRCNFGSHNPGSCGARGDVLCGKVCCGF